MANRFHPSCTNLGDVIPAPDESIRSWIRSMFRRNPFPVRSIVHLSIEPHVYPCGRSPLRPSIYMHEFDRPPSIGGPLSDIHPSAPDVHDGQRLALKKLRRNTKKRESDAPVAVSFRFRHLPFNLARIGKAPGFNLTHLFCVVFLSTASIRLSCRNLFPLK